MHFGEKDIARLGSLHSPQKLYVSYVYLYIILKFTNSSVVTITKYFHLG